MLFCSYLTAKEIFTQYYLYNYNNNNLTIPHCFMFSIFPVHINKESRVLILYEQYSINYNNVLHFFDLFNIVWFGWLASLFILLLSREERMNITLLMKIPYIESQMMIRSWSKWLYFTRYTAFGIVILINHSPDKRYNEIRKLPRLFNLLNRFVLRRRVNF